MGSLTPPENFRRTTVRACGNCLWFLYGEAGASLCVRPRGPVFCTGDGEEWEHVCDKWSEDREDEHG